MCTQTSLPIVLVPDCQISLGQEDLPCYVWEDIINKVVDGNKVDRRSLSSISRTSWAFHRFASLRMEKEFLQFCCRNVGSKVRGKISRIVKYGAFLKLPTGIEGLIHVTELSPSAFAKIEDVVSPGKDLFAKIVAVHPEDKKICLSITQ